MSVRNARLQLNCFGTTVLVLVLATVPGCGGGSGSTVTTVTQTVPATTAEPTLPKGNHASAAQSPYWAWKLTALDPDLKQFADYYAKEFCEKDRRFYSIDVSGQLLPIEYGFYRNKIGEPISAPTWADDVEVKSLLGSYIVSTYCPADRE